MVNIERELLASHACTSVDVSVRANVKSLLDITQDVVEIVKQVNFLFQGNFNGKRNQTRIVGSTKSSCKVLSGWKIKKFFSN